MYLSPITGPSESRQHAKGTGSENQKIRRKPVKKFENLGAKSLLYIAAAHNWAGGIMMTTAATHGPALRIMNAVIPYNRPLRTKTTTLVAFK